MNKYILLLAFFICIMAPSISSSDSLEFLSINESSKVVVPSELQKLMFQKEIKSKTNSSIEKIKNAFDDDTSSTATTPSSEDSWDSSSTATTPSSEDSWESSSAATTPSSEDSWESSSAATTPSSEDSWESSSTATTPSSEDSWESSSAATTSSSSWSPSSSSSWSPSSSTSWDSSSYDSYSSSGYNYDDFVFQNKMKSREYIALKYRELFFLEKPVEMKYYEDFLALKQVGEYYRDNFDYDNVSPSYFRLMLNFNFHNVNEFQVSTITNFIASCKGVNTIILQNLEIDSDFLEKIMFAAQNYDRRVEFIELDNVRFVYGGYGWNSVIQLKNRFSSKLSVSLNVHPSNQKSYYYDLVNNNNINELEIVGKAITPSFIVNLICKLQQNSSLSIAKFGTLLPLEYDDFRTLESCIEYLFYYRTERLELTLDSGLINDNIFDLISRNKTNNRIRIYLSDDL